jgi:hypothetical protein
MGIRTLLGTHEATALLADRANGSFFIDQNERSPWAAAIAIKEKSRLSPPDIFDAVLWFNILVWRAIEKGIMPGLGDAPDANIVRILHELDLMRFILSQAQELGLTAAGIQAENAHFQERCLQTQRELLQLEKDLQQHVRMTYTLPIPEWLRNFVVSESA